MIYSSSLVELLKAADSLCSMLELAAWFVIEESERTLLRVVVLNGERSSHEYARSVYPNPLCRHLNRA